MGQEQSHDLITTFRAVERARSTLDDARTESSPRGAATLEQQALLEALEDCAVALTAHGHPMSYRMHNELEMYRALFSTTRRRAP